MTSTLRLSRLGKFVRFSSLIAGISFMSPAACIAEEEMKAPENVAAAPENAEVTDSGLASIVLTEGKGDSPRAVDTVTVHYSGWTTDGELFDSSVERGSPSSFPLNGVIKGWTEGLQLMKVGEKRRFWIPAELAYGENPGGGRPGGQLTFDVELLEIQKAPESPEGVESIPEDGEETGSGLVSKVVSEGKGEQANEQSLVEIHFALWSKEGSLIESSRDSGRTIKLPISKLPFAGLQEGVALLKEGERRLFWLPQSLTFGDNLPPGAPSGHIVADIELIKLHGQVVEPKAPDNVAATPEDAEKSESGLAWIVLEKGDGGDKPSAASNVTVHYSGWTTDGKLFDSSVSRGEPASFPLNGVIAGWTEGLQLMTVGEKRRFWIPAELAYGNDGSGGRPAGLLVFDVELLKIN